MNAHIERKKSKCDYELPSCPTDEQVSAIESTVNEVISRNLDEEMARMASLNQEKRYFNMTYQQIKDWMENYEIWD